MPQMPRLFLIFHLSIGNGCIADRTPVNHSGSLINISLFVHFHKHFSHCFVAALIHCKTFPVPITGRPHLLKLGHNAPAVFLSPGPGTLQEFLPSQFIFINSLFFQLLSNLNFRSNGGMICAWLPQGIVPLHPLKANQNVLHGIVQRMSHV